MRVRTIGGWVVMGLMTMTGAASCTDDDDTGARQVAVLVAAIRAVVDDAPVADIDPPLPVVYVVGAGEVEFAATVQADVAEDLQDEVDVRFADERDEAIDVDAVDAPVPDDGVLLMVGEIPANGDTIGVPIEMYRSDRDQPGLMVFSMTADDEGWTVTATSPG